jgi:hypothetical protein
MEGAEGALNMRSGRLWIAAMGTLSLISCELCSQDETLPRRVTRASQVMGMNVRNASNESLGNVEDLVLDRDRGTIAYVVLSVGGSLSVGNKLRAVPWDALRPTTDRAAFVVDVSKDRFEKAPGFDKNRWPDMLDPKWSAEIRSFYGTTGAELDGVSRTIVVQKGTVKMFQRVDPARVVITTDHGDILAELAPLSFIDRERLTFDSKANVMLKGCERMHNGRRILVVTEVTKNGRAIRLRRDDLTPVWAEAAAVRAAAPSPLRDVTGTVTQVESGPCESAQGRQVTLQTADGDRVIGLGPGTYLDTQRLSVRPNETITVRGYDYDRNGTRVFIATEVRKGNETWKLRQDDGTPLWR